MNRYLYDAIPSFEGGTWKVMCYPRSSPGWAHPVLTDLDEAQARLIAAVLNGKVAVYYEQVVETKNGIEVSGEYQARDDVKIANLNVMSMMRMTGRWGIREVHAAEVRGEIEWEKPDE